MNKKCLGCGVLLQDENITKEGYTTSLENDLCRRCFRLKNYGEYQSVVKNNDEYLRVLDSLKNTLDLVLYVADILNMPEDFSDIENHLGNNIILIINKKDVVPKSVRDDKITHYYKEKYPFFREVLVISSEKNYGFDYLLGRIKFFQTTRNVYVIGYTNAGKSTLINRLIRNYSDSDQELTISPLPSTTLNTIKIEINDYLSLIDTPGFVDNASLTNYVSKEMLQKLNPKKEIKPKTYQIKRGQSILVEDFFRIDYVEGDKNSFTFYISNDLKVKRIHTSKHDDLCHLNKTDYEFGYHKDLVIKGLGFIKMVDKARVSIYLDQKVQSFIRDNLI